MAEAAHGSHAASQDLSEQLATYKLVGGLFKWGSLTLAVLLTMLIMWFCAGAGFFTGLFTGAVIAALGVAFLRSRPTDEH